MRVGQAMRRQVVALPAGAGLDRAIRTMIKFKVDALLALDQEERPLGVLSKTDVMGAYYAELPLETPLEMIMASPVLFTRGDEPLEAALQRMTDSSVKRLYVADPESSSALGVLSYADIVGVLYKFCRSCPLTRERAAGSDDNPRERLRVGEVMSPGVDRCRAGESLAEVMESLGAGGFGAVLISDPADSPLGVISKTDLILSFLRGVPVWTEAGEVMNSPVLTASEEDFLDQALTEMIFKDIHRLFVAGPDGEGIVGVLSLSDAARARSGSCKACVVTRIG